METNQKTIRTKKAIQAAIIQLIEEKTLAKVSITDITRIAKINRGTFYLHFIDKPDLVHQYETNLLEPVAQVLNQSMPLLPRSAVEIQTVIKAVLTDVDHHRTLFQALLSKHGDPTFVNQIKELLAKYIQINSQMTTSNKRIIPAKYAEELVLDSIIGIITVWLNDSNPDSINDVAKIVTATRFIAPVTLTGMQA